MPETEQMETFTMPPGMDREVVCILCSRFNMDEKAGPGNYHRKQFQMGIEVDSCA